MGRLALLLVAVAAGLVAYSAVGRSGGLDRQFGTLEDAQEGSYARQAALSGFAVAQRHVQQAAASGGAVAMNATDVSLGAFGSYDVDIAATDSSVVVEVVGRYGDAEHVIGTDYMSGFDFPGVLMVYTAEAAPEVKSGATLTGYVTRPPSIPALNWTDEGKGAIAGLGVPLNILAEYNNELGIDEWARVTGAVSVSNSAPPYWMRDVVTEIEAHPSLVTYNELTLENSDVLGSPSNPAFVRITDHIFVNDNARGYGVLLIENGHLWMNQQGSWEGLVIIRGTGAGANIELDIEDTNRIYGAVLMYGVQSSGTRTTSSWIYGDAEVELWDTSEIYWAPDVIERLIPHLPSLQDGYVVRRRFIES